MQGSAPVFFFAYEKITQGEQTLDVGRMLEIINQRIECLYTIGHAYFMPLKENPTIKVLASIFENKIFPLLQEYFYEDYRKIQLVLGDNGKENPKHKFIVDLTDMYMYTISLMATSLSICLQSIIFKFLKADIASYVLGFPEITHSAMFLPLRFIICWIVSNSY